MAKLTDRGCVAARCPGCNGSLSTFEWVSGSPDDPVGQGRQMAVRAAGKVFGMVTKRVEEQGSKWHSVHYILLRCAGCGGGGIAEVKMQSLSTATYPHGIDRLLSFHPEARERMKLPPSVPTGIENEFREAEKCLEAGCLRAAAGLFRSVLDKTMRANGYKNKGSLQQQIDAAAADGVINEGRKKRAHEDIRVLGNDVLHDEWVPVPEDAVEAAHHYAQRILEDFYDDRPTMLLLLRAKGRTPDEDK